MHALTVKPPCTQTMPSSTIPPWSSTPGRPLGIHGVPFTSTLSLSLVDQSTMVVFPTGHIRGRRALRATTAIPRHVPQGFTDAQTPHGGKIALKRVEGCRFLHRLPSFDFFGFEQGAAQQPTSRRFGTTTRTPTRGWCQGSQGQGRVVTRRC